MKKGMLIAVITTIATIVLVGGAAIAVALLTQEEPLRGGEVLEPDYEHVTKDENAQTIPGETTGETPDVPQGGGTMNLVYSDQVIVDLKGERVSMYYQNPSSSSHSIVVQIIIPRGETQYLVAESGGIDPGYMLTEMPLNSDIRLSSGVYDGVMKLWFFDSETGEKAVVDTNIPIRITVK